MRIQLQINDGGSRTIKIPNLIIRVCCVSLISKELTELFSNEPIELIKESNYQINSSCFLFLFKNERERETFNYQIWLYNKLIWRRKRSKQKICQKKNAVVHNKSLCLIKYILLSVLSFFRCHK